MMENDIQIGCSSFNEANWKGIFYPNDLPRKEWFAFYAKHFITYEMNGTFYKFPTGKSLNAWYEKAPDGFLFSVKMHKGVTHFKKFRDCEQEISDFYSVCQNSLREKLACVLFQLPPSFAYSEERLQLILDALDYNFSNVVEFRHQSWWLPEVFEAFRQKGITFCNVSYPGLPEDVNVTSNICYLRLHGIPRLFFSGYDKAALQKFSDVIINKNATQSFVYFNNTASKHGIGNALTFKEINSGRV